MTLIETQSAVPTKASLTREYVTGGPLVWYGDRQRALPPYIDDLTWDLGDDLYERMDHDPMVNAAGNVLITGVLEESVGLLPAVDQQDQDGYDESKELVDFCNPILANLTIPLDDVCRDLLSAMKFGNRVAENVWAYDSTYTGKTQIILSALKVKPRSATAFVVDPYMNVLGLLGQVEGQQVTLPRERFAVLSFRPKDSDPRGSTIYRPAYNAWDLKQRTWPEYLRYLVQFASPSLFATTAENAGNEEITDSNGIPTGQYMTAVEALLSRMLAFQNGSAMAAPYGTLLKELWSQGNGEAFLKSFQLYNREIAMGIVSQTRALLESEFGSKADSQTANDVLTMLIRQLKRSICLMLKRDVLRLLVRYNFGPKLELLTPYVTLGETVQRDWAGDLLAAAKAGYGFHPSQLAALDERFNVPVRDINAVDEAAKTDTPPQPPNDPTDDGESEEEA